MTLIFWKPAQARILSVHLLASLSGIIKAEPSSGSSTLWYRQPAKRWIEALSVSNGRLKKPIITEIVETSGAICFAPTTVMQIRET